MLSEPEVRRLAALSRLDPTDAQVAQWRGDLAAVLAYAECLARVDLRGIEPMARPGEEANRLAEDEPGPTLPPEALARLAPALEDGYIPVPKVVGEGGGA
jgi:aspartyl-tRNA(Asn)/glutamyl-tRNA(Gln) amidotransferase subunit C